MRLILRFIADGVVAVLLLGACSHRSETQTNRAPAADAELKQLAEPDHTFESLTHIYTVMAGSNEGDPINTITQDHQSDLIRLLESSRDNRIITLATLILFKVNTLDPIIYFAVAGMLALVAAASCFVPARRATQVDPMVALRYE